MLLILFSHKIVKPFAYRYLSFLHCLIWLVLHGVKSSACVDYYSVVSLLNSKKIKNKIKLSSSKLERALSGLLRGMKAMWRHLPYVAFTLKQATRVRGAAAYKGSFGAVQDLQTYSSAPWLYY